MIHEKIGDAQISIRVEIMNVCGVCKMRLCPVPNFYQYYHMADYKYDDPNEAATTSV